MMRTRLIVPGSLRRSQNGSTIDIRLPWYRTLPLSVIDMPVVHVDGITVPQDDVTLEVNGRIHTNAQLREATDDWWYVLDAGTLHLRGLRPTPAIDHAIGVGVAFAPPYIPEITLFCAATRPMALATDNAGA